MEKKKNHKLGIIVPYRDRPEQLDSFIKAIKAYIQDIEYSIIVVEQEDENDFNRGKLLNIGFVKAKEIGCDYVIFHDIDMHPINVSYKYSDRVLHLITELNTPPGFERDNFDEYFGGVTLFPVDIFEKINGYSNEFWGWGFEDDNLMLRCVQNNVILDKKIVAQKSRSSMAAKFNGADSLVVCPNIFNTVRDFTISTTFSIDHVHTKENEVADIFSVFSIPGFDTSLNYNSFRNFSFQFWKKDLSSMNIASDHFPEGTYNATIVINNRSAPKRVSFWLNGNQVGWLNYDKMMDIKKADNFFLGVGDPYREEKQLWMDGSISTFTVYNEALDQLQIARLGANVNRSVWEVIEPKPILYYDGKFIRGNELIDLSGNGYHGTCVNVKQVETEYSETKEVPIPYRRTGLFQALKHDENGYTEGYWKTWQSRVNQIEYYKQFYDTKFNSNKEGLNTLYYEKLNDKVEDDVIYIKAALTN